MLFCELRGICSAFSPSWSYWDIGKDEERPIVSRKVTKLIPGGFIERIALSIEGVGKIFSCYKPLMKFNDWITINIELRDSYIQYFIQQWNLLQMNCS